jgi:hypothetical protein
MACANTSDTTAIYSSSLYLDGYITADELRWQLGSCGGQLVQGRESKPMRTLWLVTIYDAQSDATDTSHQVADDESKAKMKAFVQYLQGYEDDEVKPNPDDLDFFVERVGPVREAPKGT